MSELTLILEESPDNQIDVLLGQFVATPASVIQYANAAAASASSANLSMTNAGVSATQSAASATASATSASQAASSASNSAGSASAAAASAVSAANSASLTANPAREVFNVGTHFAVGAPSITLANDYGSIDNIDIYADGYPQLDSTLAGKTLGFPNGGAPNVSQIIVRGRRALAIGTASDGTVTDAKVAAGTRLITRLNDVRSARDPQFGALCDGVTDDSAACQAIANAVPSGATWEVLVPASMVVNSAVTAGAGTIAWKFLQGASLLGTGSLPFHSSAMTYNGTPNVGKRSSIWHGSQANPTTDGTTPSVYIQRVDKSVVGDDPAHLIPALYVTHKRLPGGTGWLYGGYFYLEDQSTTGAAQSVALASSVHGVTKGDVWGLYTEAWTHNPNVTATAFEVDTFNYSGSDYTYNDTFPTTAPFTCGVWNISFGPNKNSFAHGIASGGVANMWRTGIYMKTFSIDHIGIDIQAQPSTLIRFKYGASTDGTGVTPGGIGLDVGSQIDAAYGTGANQCAIHLRDQRLGFGSFGYMQFNAGSNTLEFWAGGSRRGFIDMAGADHAL